MAGMNLVRTGTAAVTGLVSGVVEKQVVGSLALGGQSIPYAGVAEAGMLVVGAVMQFVAPFTMPNVADGLVDGGAALVLRRVTGMLMPG